MASPVKFRQCLPVRPSRWLREEFRSVQFDKRAFTYHPRGFPGAAANECTSSCRLCVVMLGEKGVVGRQAVADCLTNFVWAGKVLGLDAREGGDGLAGFCPGWAKLGHLRWLGGDIT